MGIAAEPSLERPNVLMILADDQSYRDFGFLGNELVHTPNLDALAARSAVFPNGYVPMSVCRPSLATLLTGLYPHQHGIYFNHPPPGLGAMRKMTAEQYRATRATTDPLIERLPTLPRILANHGYRCLQTGKHWEGHYSVAGFTDGMTLGLPTNRESSITGTRRQNNGELVAHGNGDAGLVIGRETMQPIEQFLDQVVDSNGERQQPFFVWYAPFLPHTPFDAPAEFHQPYKGKNVPAHLRPYYAEIARFDATVGQLLRMLKNRGQSGNTLIVFASDNGFRPDEKRHDRQNQRSKLSSFEDGLRTPVLISLPGQSESSVHRQLVSTVDLVPTVLAAVGLASERSARMTGLDLTPAVKGQSQLPDRPVFGAIYPNDTQKLNAAAAHVRARWVRYQHYKLLLPGPAEPSIAAAFYDLNTDPFEQQNLINSGKHADIIQSMTDMANQWWSAE